MLDPFFLFFSFLIIAAGFYLVISDYYHSKNGYHTRGTVIKVIGKWSAIGSTLNYLYYPIVRFELENSQALELKLELGVSIPIFYKGQSVKIIYYKGKVYPNNFGWKVFNWTVLVLGFGIAFYQINELANSEIWESFGGFWKILKIIL